MAPTSHELLKARQPFFTLSKVGEAALTLTTNIRTNEKKSVGKKLGRPRDDLLAGGDGDLPDADLVVGVAGEQGLAVGGPGHGQALGLDGGLVAGAAGHLGLKLLHHVLALQVPDLDDGAGGGAEPVPGRRRRQVLEIFKGLKVQYFTNTAKEFSKFTIHTKYIRLVL